tara:strand:+ start:37 stop:492 length:456 start_codon:yes stop_codon:yes gene_type:complete
MCGARYRIACKGGLHSVEHVNVDDLTLASIEDIENDPSLKPEDKVLKLKLLIGRARKARDSYNTGYGELIHRASVAEDKWHKLASEQVADARNKRADITITELVNRVAVAYTASGQHLFVEDKPWDPQRMSDPWYVRQVAVSLKVEHILGE